MSTHIDGRVPDMGPAVSSVPVPIVIEELDEQLVEKLIAEALIQSDFTKPDGDGNVVADYGQLQPAVLELMLTRHVVDNKRNLATYAVTAFELYQELLPNAPGAQALPRSREEDEAKSRLIKRLWGYTNTGTSGYVQKHAGARGQVLCEALVSRTKVNEETGRREPTTERGRFLTTDGELIMTHYTGPAGAAFLRAARKLEAQLGMVTDRRPELAQPVAKQLGTVVRQAVSAVPHADLKNVRALGMSSTAEDSRQLDEQE